MTNLHILPDIGENWYRLRVSFPAKDGNGKRQFMQCKTQAILGCLFHVDCNTIL